jgi:hypothetical protein
MAQLQSPETYVDGQQVTATRLNNQTNGATLLPGAITDQTNITANTVASGDSILLYDLSATALREANVSDVLGSNVPVTTSAITAGANSDIVITPNDGVIVTGQAYTSADGLTVTVTSTAHALTVEQVILITAAATGYNGTFRVATVLTNSFTYVMTTAATAGSGTLSYTKKGLVKNPANKSIAGNLYVDGSTAVAGSEYVAGSLTVAGATTLAGAFTSSGTANFTGALQVNGTVGYVLTEIIEETIPTFSLNTTLTYSTYFTSASYTKPVGEIWIIEASYNFQKHVQASAGFRLLEEATSSHIAGAWEIEGAGTGYIHHEQNVLKYIYQSASSFTSSFKIDIIASDAGYPCVLGNTTFDSFGYFPSLTIPASKLRIYKYKTA